MKTPPHQPKSKTVVRRWKRFSRDYHTGSLEEVVPEKKSSFLHQPPKPLFEHCKVEEILPA